VNWGYLPDMVLIDSVKSINALILALVWKPESAQTASTADKH
jgi:hypothetical protein